MYTFFLALAAIASSRAASYPFETNSITAPDGSITAKFVPFGSTLTELWVPAKNGSIDVVPGYNDNSRLLSDPGHPVLGAIVGRYANRIKSCRFSIPTTKNPQPNDPNVYHTPCNDNDGEDTLHGGIYGWDRRNWTLVQVTKDSVVYRHIDNADEGFPGIVTAIATHTVFNGSILRTSVQATATKKTPIMLTQHIYWNLCGFSGCDDILDHTLTVPASRVIEVDGNRVPTGKLVNVNNTQFDFTKGKAIRSNFDSDPSFQGYDNAWIYDEESGATMSLYSMVSGVKLTVNTDQPAVQVYTASLNMDRKEAHGGSKQQYGRDSTVAIEQEGWLDAINQPEWGQDQIYDAKREFTWNTEYRFGLL
ncbi:galactose mutarotase-like protein [Mycena amicta]|nr:galactose mutarotase-like protein [Mycena amicta]